MNKRIYLSSPHMGGTEQKYIQDAFDENWIAPLGPNVNGFEADVVDTTDCGYAAALTSGTGAIHLALILAGVDKDDEVLVSSFTFSATVNPIVYVGAIPVFIDSERDTWNMDPQLLEEAIKDRISRGKMPKAVIVVHLYGMPAKMQELSEVCIKYDITLIEDAAEALGSKYDGKHVGTFGTFGIYSFNGNKILTTSGGGMLVSKDKNFIEEARFLSTQARDNAPYYLHSKLGYNYRLSNILAGVGRGQMEVLADRVASRRNVNHFYKTLFEGVAGVTFLTEPDERFFSNYWLTTLTIDASKAGFDKDDIINALAEDNIEARMLWNPMHRQPVFEGYDSYQTGVSDDLFANGVCLPSGSNMEQDDFDRIEKALNKLIKK